MPDPSAHGWTLAEPDDDFTGIVGPLWVRGRGAQREYGFVAERKYLSRYGRLHGAMVMWLADKSMAMAAWHAAGRPERLATVQLDTHFIQIVAEGSFVHAQCEPPHTTGSLAFVKAQLCVQDQAVASASGIWKFR
ncbi:MAG: PaaI family thioesterase [Betaproteobacteria bacterium]